MTDPARGSDASGSRRLVVVDGLRGVAILAVMFHHSFARFTPPGVELLGVGSSRWPLWAPLSNGWLGVSLFFVLSGFVLQAPFASGERKLRGFGDARAFYLRRARRLLPLYYFAMLFGFVFLLPTPKKSWLDFVLFLTGTFTFDPETFFPRFNWVLWSLGVEIWMSLAFPALLLAARRVGFERLWIGVALLSLAMRCFAHEMPGAYARNPVLDWLKDGPVGRLDDFALGMLLAQRWYASGRAPWRSSRVWVGLCIGLAVLYATGFCWDLVRLDRIPDSVVPLLNNGFQLGCAFGLLALLDSRSRALRWTFASPPLQVAGMMCYSLYVWHGVVLRAMAGYRFTPAELAPCLVVLLPIAVLSYRYIEFGHVRDTRSLFRPADPMGSRA